MLSAISKQRAHEIYGNRQDLYNTGIYRLFKTIAFQAENPGISYSRRNRIADAFSYGVFIYLEIMLAAFGFLYVDDLQTAPLNDDLPLHSVPFFFLNNSLFGSFEGGLSGFR
ncbi:MAG: hypothetical protein LBG08_03915 [Spirochaetaceae bacterium]|nr:hypothetical protein [Spirochaetaceae bacterium]